MSFQQKWGSYPSAEERKLLNYVYFMLNKYSPAYSIVTYRLNAKKDDTQPLLNVSMLPDGAMNMNINFDVFKTVSDDGKVEAIMLTVYKILSGALSSMGKDIERTYGMKIAELGMLMAIHDHVSHENLEQAGFSIPDPRMYQLQTGRTWSYYCEAVREKADKGEIDLDNFDMDSNTSDGIQESNAAGKKVLPTSTTNAASGQMSDQMSRSMIEDMRNSDAAKTGQSRGLFPGNAMEWIETLFQEPKISWTEFLRMKESGHARVVRTSSRKRPSRRGDLPEYEGRIRRGGLQVWCVIDVSGSRTGDVIATAHPEMRDMVVRGADIWLIQVDASVQAVERFGGEKYEMEMFGRGGTDMEEAFRKKEEIIKKTGEPPDFWVIFTDGHTGRLTIPPDEECLIVLDDTGMKPDDFRKTVCDHPDVVVLDTKPPGLNDLIE